jgi:rhamnosyltransferase
VADPRVSVLIPTRDPGPDVEAVLSAIFEQEVDFGFEVVVVDSGSGPADLRRMERFPLRLDRIAPAEFGQGRTRNRLAERARGELLFFLSQDAQPASRDWMRRLAAALDDPAVAGAYARQLPRPDADPLIRFFLDQLYDAEPARRRLTTERRARIGQIFFRNVSSAIRREVWRSIPFRDVVMSEDQHWAHDVLRRGYEIVYEPRARVYHTHRYTLGSLFRRNYLSGASLRGLIADPPLAVAARGLSYTGRQALFLLRERRASLLPYMLTYEAVRSLAFALGSLRGAGRAGADRTAPQ